MQYLIVWVRVFLGAHALLSGLNHFLEFFPLPDIGSSPAGPFVMEMMQVGLYDMIKLVEVVAGLCLVLNFYVPLALILEFPITVSIFWLNVFIDGSPRPTFTGVRELAFHLILFAAYAGYYRELFISKAPLREIWRRV